MAEDALGTAVQRIVNRVGHWTPGRWRDHAGDVHALVQRLADLAAEAESEPRRRVPRLDNDLAIVDQLRVVAGDLTRARPAARTLADAAEDVLAVARTL